MRAQNLGFRSVDVCRAGLSLWSCRIGWARPRLVAGAHAHMPFLSGRRRQLDLRAPEAGREVGRWIVIGCVRAVDVVLDCFKGSTLILPSRRPIHLSSAPFGKKSESERRRPVV